MNNTKTAGARMSCRHIHLHVNEIKNFPLLDGCLIAKRHPAWHVSEPKHLAKESDE